MEYRHNERTMHPSLFGLFALLIVGAFPHHAWADWGISGAQYSCSATKGTFELLPHDQSSADSPEGIPVQKSFKALPNGLSNLSCNLRNRKLKTQIGVTPPQPRGMCMGGGSVQLTSLAVDGVELLDGNLPFDWGCENEESVVKIVVRATAQGIDFVKCATGGAATGADTKEKCTTKSINIDAIIAKTEILDHNLADIATQEATSATKMPPANDLATLFPLGLDPDDIPLCAHWSDIFLNSMIAKDNQWHGRIAGSDRERVFIHRASPKLCHDAADDGCTPSAYLLPGDRVDVGFICGPWTYVQYERHIRTKANIRGWVETARLYGIEKGYANGDTASGPFNGHQLAAPTDPLIQAAAINDLAKIRALIAAGANPDGLETSGAPLGTAATAGNIDAVKLLLSLGASAKPHFSDGTCRDLFMWSRATFNIPSLEDPDLFTTLVKAGADLSCRTGNWLTTPLMNVSATNRIQEWHSIQDHLRPEQHLENSAALAARLLAAGAEPNLADLAGETALFYAAEANNVDVAAVLLNSGANPNISTDSVDRAIRGSMGDQRGSTPLMRAYAWYPLTLDPTLIRLLLDHGANPNYRNSSSYDADCDETTQGKCTFQGQTVLTRAAEDGDFTIVRLLLERGADPHIAREDGVLPADIARQNRQPKVADLIERYLNHH